MGLQSALGGLARAWQRLLAGQSGIARRQPFAALPPRPMGQIGERPARLAALAQEATAAALTDAALAPPRPDSGVALGSSRGHQGEWEQLAQARAQGQAHELAHWPALLPNAAATAAAQQLAATGPVLAPMAACSSGLWAIAQGGELLQAQQCQLAIAGGMEAPLTPLTLAGFERMGALATTGCYPFDRQREGLAPAEGGAALVLELASAARARGAAPYGYLLGTGFSCDAYHPSHPCPDGGSAALAIEQCLARSGLAPADIDAIHAHGTGTPLNDWHEAELIRKRFRDSVPVSATKGATGHALGGSGALSVAFSLLALQQQTLPPCVGLTDPAFALDCVTAARPARLRYLLCLNFGFGGQNAALVLAAAL